MQRKCKCKPEPHQLKPKLECRDAKIEKFNSKITKLQEKQSVSQVGNLEEKLSKAEKAMGTRDKDIAN